MSNSLQSVLNESSDTFHTLYGQYALHNLKPIEHIVIYLDGELLLLKKSAWDYQEIKRASTAATDPMYNLEKIIAHYSVLVDAIYDALHKQTMPKDDVAKHIHHLIAELNKISSHRDFLKPHHREGIQLTLNALQQVARCPAQDYEHIHHTFLKDIALLNQNCCTQAADLQLLSMHQILRDFLSLGVNLHTTYTILMGAAGPRQDYLKHQFFQKLYNDNHIQPSNSAGIYYAEVLPENIHSTPQDYLIMGLARYLFNHGVGERLLNDQNAMYSDVLGDAAKKHLTKQNYQSDTGKTSKCPYRPRS